MSKKLMAVLFGTALYLGVFATGHAQADGVSAESGTDAASLTDGEIKRVDLEAGKVTIKHGPIKNLDMPPMTMVFAVREGAPLAGLKAGDKIRFAVTKESGKYLASEIQAAP
jgi:Cu(I)/Ag(I) efflux system periplasmic protein CusF